MKLHQQRDIGEHRSHILVVDDGHPVLIFTVDIDILDGRVRDALDIEVFLQRITQRLGVGGVAALGFAGGLRQEVQKLVGA